MGPREGMRGHHGPWASDPRLTPQLGPTAAEAAAQVQQKSCVVGGMARPDATWELDPAATPSPTGAPWVPGPVLILAWHLQGHRQVYLHHRNVLHAWQVLVPLEKHRGVTTHDR